MTLLGIVFWGTCAIAIGVGYFLQKKYGAGSPEKNIKQLENEEIASKAHNNDSPRF